MASGNPALRNPITGIAGCCARAADERDELAPPHVEHGTCSLQLWRQARAVSLLHTQPAAEWAAGL